MLKHKRLTLVAEALLVMAGTTQVMAADTHFDNFHAISSSVAAGLLPESAPFKLSSPNFLQVRIADRTTQLSLGEANSGNRDMITANETGLNAGRYLFNPFETSKVGIQRIDLTTGLVKTIVQPGTQNFVSGDASRSTPRGGYLTTEESWVKESIWFAREADNNGVARSVARWASLATIGAEPAGLYFDKFNVNAAYVNVHHLDSLVDSTILISAVPEHGVFSMLLAGLSLMGTIIRRRSVNKTF